MDGDKSREDYLEAILVLSKKNEAVRNVDIAAYLGYAAPSVSIAVKKLAQEKYIFIDDSKAVVLTPKGRLKAEQIYERHLVLTLILMELGVSKDTASLDACRLEHHMTDETFNRIKEFYFKNYHNKN